MSSQARFIPSLALSVISLSVPCSSGASDLVLAEVLEAQALGAESFARRARRVGHPSPQQYKGDGYVSSVAREVGDSVGRFCGDPPTWGGLQLREAGGVSDSSGLSQSERQRTRRR